MTWALTGEYEEIKRKKKKVEKLKCKGIWKLVKRGLTRGNKEKIRNGWKIREVCEYKYKEAKY